MISYGAQTEKGTALLNVIGGQLSRNLGEVVHIGFVADGEESQLVGQEIVARGGVATTLISSETAAACGKRGMIIVVESTLVQAKI